MNNTKTRRILNMLMLLSGNRRYTIQELEERFEQSGRTVFRDLELIESAGFMIERESGYRLLSDAPVTRSLQKLFHFSEEEACILYQTLEQIKGASPLKERLARKLHTLYDLKILEKLRRSDDLAKVQIIGESIKTKKQVTLKSYRSGHSNRIEDRLVEVFDFMPDYRAVWCYDHSGRMCKQFKVSRMETVVIEHSGWQYEHLHKRPFTDAFRISAAEPLAEVEMLLSLKACNLLTEEFPLADRHIQETAEGYYLKIPVADFTGIGRFIMGLPEDIAILSPRHLKDYIRDKMQEHLKKKKKLFPADRI